MLNVINNLYDYNMNEYYVKCRIYGYSNNWSEDRYNFDRVKEYDGNFWGLESKGSLIATAGCLRFPEVSANAFRIQYRGCEIPHTDIKKGLSRSHFNSSTFRELIPYQLEWIAKYNSDEIYLTTNLDNKNHRAMVLIAKQGFLSLHSTEELFGVEQAIWRFNIDKYITERKKLGIYTIQHPPLI